MIDIVDTIELENYLNDKSAKLNDIVEVTGEGLIEITTDDSGKTKKNLQIPVLVNGKLKLIYSPGKTARKPLETAWGTDTKNWIGKKFQIRIVLVERGGSEMKVIRINPFRE